jgi:hypothetical protein
VIRKKVAVAKNNSQCCVHGYLLLAWFGMLMIAEL